MKNTKIVVQALQEIITNNTYDETIVIRYFSPDYIQYVDGKTIDYLHFIAHVKVLKQTLAKASIKFIAIAENKETVFTHHHVIATKYDGSQIIAQVIAHFTLHEGRIIQCNELTHPIAGGEEDYDLGSRT